MHSGFLINITRSKRAGIYKMYLVDIPSVALKKVSSFVVTKLTTETCFCRPFTFILFFLSSQNVSSYWKDYLHLWWVCFSFRFSSLFFNIRHSFLFSILRFFSIFYRFFSRHFYHLHIFFYHQFRTCYHSVNYTNCPKFRFCLL